MARTKTEYDLLISCPGDVDGEVKIIEKAVKKFNDTYSDVLAIRLNTKHWSNSSYNQSGGKAQELLNNQFIHDCDAAIAIFWTRFGSPTDRYGSGTEEEIEDMLTAGKQVFLYFSEKAVSPELLLSEESKQQFQKVKDFRKRYEREGKGIFSTFSSDKDFQEKLFAHISQHFLTLKKVEEISSQRKSALKLRGICGGKLCDTGVIQPFRFEGSPSVEEMLSEIKDLYSTIEQMNIKEKSLNQIGMAMYKNVELTDSSRDLISSFAKKIDINMSKDFFSLGGLRESLISSAALFGGRSFEGEKSEKEKYNQLVHLKDKISTLVAWAPFERTYGLLKCVRFAVSNEGTNYDEDIDILLTVPSDMIILPDQLPKLEEHSYKSITTDYSIEELFGIVGTASYNDFESSKKSFSPVVLRDSTPNLPIGLMGSTRNYEQEYYEDLNDAFEYDFFEERDTIVVKLHIDYLKHNTAVAFPTVLFVSDKLTSIEYTIQSKHNEAAINGTIEVGEQP